MIPTRIGNLEKACMVLIAGFFAFQAPRYAPDTTFIAGGYSSDTAIPVLMANSEHFSLFSLYYWGQDRFGSWPFLLYRLAGSVQFQWEPWHVFLGMYLFLHASILAFCWKRGFVALMIMLGPLHLWPQVANFLLDIAQPYGWQLACLLLAITAAERSPRSRPAPFLFGGFTFLAVWLSPSSVIYCLGMPFLAVSTGGLKTSGRWKKLLLLSFPAIVGYLLHSLLRRVVVAHNSDVYYHGYETPLKWEARWVDTALASMVGHLQGPVEAAIWLFALVLGAFVALHILRLTFSQDGFRSSHSLMGRALLHPASLTFLAGSVLFVAALLPLNWFAANQYGARYIALPRYLMLAGALLLIQNLLMGSFAPGISRTSSYKVLQNAFLLVFSTALLSLSVVESPGLLTRRQVSEAFLFRKSVASQLEKEFPGVPILGNYWETYVYSSLQKNPSLPQPGTGQYQRTPFLLPAFLQSDLILVVLRGYPAAHKENGSPSMARPVITFRSVQYDLVESREIHGLPVALYRKSEKSSAYR